jgi:Flp pilus assembly protein TadG
MSKIMCIAESEKPQPGAQRVASVTIDFRQLKGDCGSGLVEYAIVFVLFMTMILGIVDFGRALYTYHFLSNVTRDATRWAAVNGADCGPPPNGDNSCNGQGYMDTRPATEPDVQTYVTNHTPPGIDTTKLTTTVTWPVSTDSPAICAKTPNAPGCTVQVQTSYVFSFLFAYVHKTTITMSSTSGMIIAH